MIRMHHAATIALAGVGLAALSGRPAAAAPPIPTNMHGVTAQGDVPPGFDALHASEAELDGNGFPPRPHDNGRALVAWQRAVSSGALRVVPTLNRTEVKHIPPVHPALNGSQLTSENWSGYLVLGGAKAWGTSSFAEVVGDFVVPKVEQAFGACTGNWNYFSAWAGIDGVSSSDVLQAGIEADAYCASGTTGAYYGAWYEWYPSAAVQIGGFAVSPGDDIYEQVWSTSPTVGHVFLEDYNTRQSVSLTFDAPSGTTLTGDAAEWVVERPVVDGKLAHLSNYIQDFWSQMYAEDAAGHVSYPGAPHAGVSAAPVTMTDSSNAVISSPTLLGTSAMWLVDANSALAAGSP